MPGLTLKFWLATWAVILLIAAGIAVLVTQYARFELAHEAQRAPDQLMDRLASEFEYRLNNNRDVGALLQNNSVSRFAVVYLVSPNGQDYLQRPLPEHADIAALSQSESDAPVRARNGHPPILARAIYQDEQRYLMIVAFQHNLPPVAGLFQRIGFGALLALAVFITGLAALFLAYMVVRPLNRLAEASDRMGEGEVDLQLSNQLLSRRDEVGHLARRMSAASSEIQRLLTGHKELVRDVSHEVRSPLARLQIAAELLQEQPDNPTAVKRVIEDVHVIDQLVESLLLLSKGEALGLGAPKEMVDLIEVLNSCVAAVGFEARAKDIHIHFSPGPGPVFCLASESLLVSLFENLLRNAVLHSPEATIVHVSVKLAQAHCIVVVADQGPGVPESHLADIFEPFTRIDVSRARTTGGHGLGLAIARKIVRDHDGDIDAENLAEGGLAMRVTLPFPIELAPSEA
ncbi:MAG: sensor histidine kinase [bacterium]